MVVTVERRAERQLGVVDEGAQRGRRLVGVAADGEIALHRVPRLGGHARAALQRRLLEEAIGDLARRAAADGGDAGDGEQVLDEGARALLVDALERGEDAGMVDAAIARRIEDAGEPLALGEAADDAAPPLRRDGEPVEQVGEEARVADRRFELDRRRQRRGLEREGEDLGIRRLAVGLPEVLDAGLDEFARAVAAQPEHRPAIGI